LLYFGDFWSKFGTRIMGIITIFKKKKKKVYARAS